MPFHTRGLSISTNSVALPTERSLPMNSLQARGYNREYYEEHRALGLNYANYGNWQEEYGRWLVAALGWSGKRILDVGCACGAIGRGLLQAGAAEVQGVDLCEWMIDIGRRQWPELKLFVCDCLNLHLFADEGFDAIHCSQVAEHWKAEHVPIIWKELLRVLKRGCVSWFCFDTSERRERAESKGEWGALGDDPTHSSLQPLAWWRQSARAAGWIDLTDTYHDELLRDPSTFLNRYDWGWVCLGKE